MKDNSHYNTENVDYLFDSISNKKDVAIAFKSCIRSGAWKHYKSKLGKEINHTDFLEFLKRKYPYGLDIESETLRKMINYDIEALDLFDQLTTRPHGTNRFTNDIDNDNIMIYSEQGTSKQYALRKLRKDKPDLHKQVLSGDISPNAAMIKAGFRKKSFTITIDNSINIANRLKNNLSEDMLKEVIELLNR